MKTKYDWSDVPSEVKWIATDADGYAFYWREKPTQSKYGGWLSIGRETSLYLYGHLNPDNNPFKGYWQDSLEERPND